MGVARALRDKISPFTWGKGHLVLVHGLLDEASELCKV